MSSIYRIEHQLVEPDTPEWAPALEKAYQSKDRPRCQCQTAGVEMYIAKIAGKFVLKRMPNSGEQHAPGCDAYEPPAECSGLGQVLGTAIEENVDDGVTGLKLAFSLSKGGSRISPGAAAEEADSVKTDGNKLTLRSTLHYFWEQAEFNRWHPGMDGKRSWGVIRRFLLLAAQNKRAKGQDLSELLFIPEPFFVDKKAAIEEARRDKFSKIMGVHKTGRRLNVVISEVKEVSQSQFGFKIVVKHMPDCHFMLNADIHRRLMKRFANELALSDSSNEIHLIMIGTFSVGITGVPSIEEMALMTVNHNWIPIESMFDRALVQKLTDSGRRFVKGLRYNLPDSKPLASAVLSDTEPKATALYIVPPGVEDDYVSATEGLMAESSLASWLWRAGDEAMPELPSLPAPRPKYAQQQRREPVKTQPAKESAQ